MPSASLGGFRQTTGKYLVQRRDGTVPTWTWFVMGARDPHAPAALRAYADSIYKTIGDAKDPAATRIYADDVLALADAFDRERAAAGAGDPEARPHRVDDPRIVALMERPAPPAPVDPNAPVPEQVWTGTGWVRNPALPPLPEPPAPVPIPGFRGGSFVPADIRTVNPTPAITTRPPPVYPTAQSSPTRPIVQQNMVPVMPVLPPPIALPATSPAMVAQFLAGHDPRTQSPPAPLPGMGPPVPAQAAVAYAQQMNAEAAQRALAAPPPSRAVPEAPRPVSGDETRAAMQAASAIDPVAEQIARARAAAQSGKL